MSSKAECTLVRLEHCDVCPPFVKIFVSDCIMHSEQKNTWWRCWLDTCLILLLSNAGEQILKLFVNFFRAHRFVGLENMLQAL